MGFFGSSSSYKSSSYNPVSYRTPVSMPGISTNTKLKDYETPKEAEMADLSEYEKSERRRLMKNGVRGTFTVGMGEE